jgi:hypothetical protein
MAGQNTAVFGIYREREGLERAAEILRGAGFRNTDISVLFSENEGTKDFAFEKGTKALEGTAAGAGTGAVAGGVLGWLVGIGALAIPGLGPFLAAGPIVAALAGVGAGGMVAGLVGALIGLGMPEYEAKRYEGQIRRGGMLMSVHCDNPDWVKRGNFPEIRIRLIDWELTLHWRLSPILMAMILFRSVWALFRSGAALQLEILALRHQLGVLQRSVKRPKLTAADRFLWAQRCQFWTSWRTALVMVKPETVISWHRKGFRLFWSWKVRHGQPGRPPVPQETRKLIRQMSRDNPLWGAPRIHGELLKLGIDI